MHATYCQLWHSKRAGREIALIIRDQWSPNNRVEHTVGGYHEELEEQLSEAELDRLANKDLASRYYELQWFLRKLQGWLEVVKQDPSMGDPAGLEHLIEVYQGKVDALEDDIHPEFLCYDQKDFLGQWGEVDNLGMVTTQTTVDKETGEFFGPEYAGGTIFSQSGVDARDREMENENRLIPELPGSVPNDYHTWNGNGTGYSHVVSEFSTQSCSFDVYSPKMYVSRGGMWCDNVRVIMDMCDRGMPLGLPKEWTPETASQFDVQGMYEVPPYVVERKAMVVMTEDRHKFIDRSVDSERTIREYWPVYNAEIGIVRGQALRGMPKIRKISDVHTYTAYGRRPLLHLEDGEWMRSYRFADVVHQAGIGFKGTAQLAPPITRLQNGAIVKHAYSKDDRYSVYEPWATALRGAFLHRLSLGRVNVCRYVRETEEGVVRKRQAWALMPVLKEKVIDETGKVEYIPRKLVCVYCDISEGQR